MKDAKGHGSSARGPGGRKPIPDHPYHARTNDELRYIVKDASEAAKAAQSMGKLETKYNDQVNDAATVLGYRARGGASDAPSDILHSGTSKSDAAPIHDSMAHGFSIGDRVHLGFGAKGGAGFPGRLTKIEGNTAHIVHDSGKTYSGPLRFLSK
jgi:hypothetical protein